MTSGLLRSFFCIPTLTPRVALFLGAQSDSDSIHSWHGLWTHILLWRQIARFILRNEKNIYTACLNGNIVSKSVHM